MKEVKVCIDGVLSVHHVPESYDELSREQLLTVCSSLEGALTESALYASLTGICKETWEEIPFPKRYFLMRLLDFVLEKEPAFSKQLLPFIEAGGVRFIGYQPTFSNTSWEEFIYADGYMLSGRFREAAAVLYRPQREDYAGETDRRVPFTIYGADTRMKTLAKLSDDQLAAFVLCYKTLRERNLVKRYPNVFARSPKRRKISPSQPEASFSWVSVHRDLMGDRFYDEAKFYASNVHVILNRLDRVIREGGKK
ncbi:MAG: hypothetical protein IKN98_01090 [Bacteroidales bacterium]|nr:hypothetical protein [Bacteroidales bacterium]